MIVGWIVGRRRSAWLAAGITVVAIALIGGLGKAERVATPIDTLPAGKASTEVAQRTDSKGGKSGDSAVVLYTSTGGRISPAALAQLREKRLTPPSVGPLDLARDGSAAISVVPVPESDAEQIALRVGEIRSQAKSDLPAGVQAAVTGPAAVQADLAAVFDGADVDLLMATALIVALLLLVTYRSPVLWLIPFGVVAIADQLAAVLATQALLALGMTWDQSTIGILSVLVFGAGTDYSLLLISRYRDELRRVEDRFAAMRVALARTAESILVSSVTVVLGLLTLLLSLVPSTRGLGVACAIGVVIAAAFALVLLPAVLVLFGRWVFWPRVPQVGDPTLVEAERSLWHRIGQRVAARPGIFIFVTVLLLLAMSSGVTQIKSGLSQADQFLKPPEAITAAKRLAKSFPEGTASPTVVVTRTADAAAVIGAVEKVPDVVSARVSGNDAGFAQIQVVLDVAPGSPMARSSIVELRSALAGRPQTWVGGKEAEAVDEAAAASRDRQVIMPLILVMVLIGRVLLLRSLVAPVILVATVVATFLAALGASWMLFTQVLGFERLDSGVPLLAFLFLVALGVDYNIFLVSRAVEESPGRGPEAGMLRALTATGGVITSAGILLAAVFAVLGVLPLVVLAQLGIVICIGVLLDALVVRTILVPAIAFKTGRHFWWPRQI